MANYGDLYKAATAERKAKEAAETAKAEAKAKKAAEKKAAKSGVKEEDSKTPQ